MMLIHFFTTMDKVYMVALTSWGLLQIITPGKQDFLVLIFSKEPREQIFKCTK